SDVCSSDLDRAAPHGRKRKQQLSTVSVHRLARFPAIAGPGGRPGAASNGCSCRTGLCSLNTITWDLVREARALQSALPGPAASLVRKQISRMLSWARTINSEWAPHEKFSSCFVRSSPHRLHRQG